MCKFASVSRFGERLIEGFVVSSLYVSTPRIAFHIRINGSPFAALTYREDPPLTPFVCIDAYTDTFPLSPS